MFPLRDTAPRQGVPLITWALILINGLVFVYELTLPEYQLEAFVYTFGLVPSRYGLHASGGLLGANYWPLLTMMFVHGGWFHLLGNLWTLHLFGDNVEMNDRDVSRRHREALRRNLTEFAAYDYQAVGCLDQIVGDA